MRNLHRWIWRPELWSKCDQFWVVLSICYWDYWRWLGRTILLHTFQKLHLMRKRLKNGGERQMTFTVTFVRWMCFAEFFLAIAAPISSFFLKLLIRHLVFVSARRSCKLQFKFAQISLLRYQKLICPSVKVQGGTMAVTTHTNVNKRTVFRKYISKENKCLRRNVCFSCN